jgi:large subunit ribosomal protein L24
MAEQQKTQSHKSKLKIKKGDLVQVVSGATQARGGDRGKQGKVIEVLAGSNRVLVEGVNRVKKHKKVGATGRGARTGGIETHEAPLHISNVMLVDPSTKKPTRVGSRTETVERDGRERTVRVRVAKRSGKDI